MEPMKAHSNSILQPDALRGLDALVERVSQVVDRCWPRRKRTKSAIEAEEPVAKSA
jgi:hypothetical protein